MTLTCERPPAEKYEPQLNLFCVLLSHRSQQEAVVDRTYRMDEVAKYDLKSVRVILSKNSLSDTFAQVSETLGRFVSKNHIPIIPCSTYRILVTAQGFDTLTGMTTVPGDFEIIHPLEGDTISFDDSLVFKKSKGAAGYSVNFLVLADTRWFAVDRALLHSIEDSIIRINLFDFHLPFDSGLCKVKIAALDTNYFSYTHYGYEEPLLAAGISNGVGLFGSAVIESVMVFTRGQK